VAVCCSVLQRVVVYFSVLQRVAVRCRVCFMNEMSESFKLREAAHLWRCIAACCSVLQRVAVCCSALHSVFHELDE